MYSLYCSIRFSIFENVIVMFFVFFSQQVVLRMTTTLLYIQVFFLFLYPIMKVSEAYILYNT